MEPTQPGRQRPSIDERAERRRSMQRDYPDRYTGLIEVLRRDHDRSAGRWVADPARWHPVARKLVALALVAVVIVVAAYVVNDIWRQERVDTWNGPTDSVTSGHEVLGCLPEGVVADGGLPTWVRYGDRTYGRSERLRPLRGMGQEGQTGQIESGYRLDRMRLLLPSEAPAGETPELVLVIIEPSVAATVYQLAPDCS